jgi:hypothetical protein
VNSKASKADEAAWVVPKAAPCSVVSACKAAAISRVIATTATPL